MAKTKMLCPFSNQLCRECPQYRGRHYYLCYYAKYRGYLGNSKKDVKQISLSAGADFKFEMPSLFPPSPKWLAFDEFIERKGE